MGTWKFTYTTAIPLPKGTRLKFDILSKGRPIDWQVPQTDLKEKKNLIWATVPGGKPVAAKELHHPDAFVPSFEFILPAEIKAGDSFSIFLGTPEQNKPEKGNRCQSLVQRRRPFNLFIDPKGKGDYREPEIFAIDVRGNKLHNIRVIVPSIVSKNRRFDITVRFEDQYGNLTNNAPEGTLIELSYEQLRENLTWKLFVPETGFLNLPNLYFNEPGIYRIQLLNMQTKEKFFSSPIKCFADSEKSLYWGLLHGESERVDSTESIEACLRHFRDERALQFFATSPFENAEETSNEVWKSLSLHVAELNEEMRFATFLGFQWFGQTPEEGLRQIIYTKDSRPLLRKKDSKSNNLKKIYKSHSPKEFISIPCFTMAKGFETTFEDFTPEYERVVEIYNAWGSSECLKEEGNPRPIAVQGKKGIPSSEKGSIRKALSRNIRFGFVAGGLDDRGIYDGLFESDQVQYSPGLTAIFSIEQTREALLQALHNRACYATTGERIVIGFSIAGAPMGAELTTKAKPGLVLNRHISGYVAGTAPLKEIAIIRNGEIFKVFNTSETFLEFEYDDMKDLGEIALASPDERPHFAYYYLRVMQEDGHIAWSSPIWIDYPDMVVAPKKKSKR